MGDNGKPMSLEGKLDACRLRVLALEEELIRQQQMFADEKQKVHTLLQNIFPAKIADELVKDGSVKVRYYKNISVLFADIENFSIRSSAYSPVELVGKLDDYFGRFDTLMKVFCLEKIKTIGDCYMCAGGLPDEDEAHPVKMVMAGLQLQHIVQQVSLEVAHKGLVPFEFRLGIHSGEAVAGVVGHHKYAYDIWGRAVNIASLMVQAGEIKKVNISQVTYELVSDVFDCAFRGSIPTKSGVAMRMYFVERLKAAFSDDDEGLVPNARFFQLAGMKKK